MFKHIVMASPLEYWLIQQCCCLYTYGELRWNNARPLGKLNALTYQAYVLQKRRHFWTKYNVQFYNLKFAQFG